MSSSEKVVRVNGIEMYVERRGEGAPLTPIWGYQGKVPGPTLRVRRDDEVRVRRLVNELPEPTTVHCTACGSPTPRTACRISPSIRLLPTRASTTVFEPPDAGTFWYHSHLYSSEQLERGLYGVLIVEESVPVAVDRDVVVVLDDWRLGSDVPTKAARN